MTLGAHGAVNIPAEADRFRDLVDAVTDYALYLLDSEGRVTSWNVGAERLTGYAAAEAVGQYFHDFFAPDDGAPDTPADILGRTAADGRYETERWWVRKDASRFWASIVATVIRDSDGQPIGFANIVRDRTEQRRAAEQLRDSERQFQLLVNGVTDYALYLLDPNGIVTNWNAGAERIKGYRASEIVGQHFSRFYTEHDRAVGMPARALQIATTEGRFEADAWRMRKDGTLFWANVVIDPIWDEQRNLLGFCKITRDITERRQAQRAMEETREKLAQAQKMEALGHLTGGVAHDFNNLLMIVSGFISIIKRKLADDASGLNAAEAIELAAKRGATLTRHLLSFARRQSLHAVVVNLGDVVETARPILDSLLGGPFQFVTTIPPDTWSVEVDVSELELAIVNLIVNARDAMPQGGTIALTAENVRRDRQGPEDIEGEFVALTLADTGQGIPPDIMAKVFDPFFTTKGVGKGTGLGLSQVHGFVHQSGGTVEIASEVGKGTRITLFLPRNQAEAGLRPKVDYTGAHAARRNVLLVEDNPEVMAATTELLRQLECDVVPVADADAAFGALAQGRFDVVLSDIVMAGAMDGIALARAVRDRYPGLPIVLTTGYSEAAAQVPFEEFTILRKPYEVSDLNQAFASLPVPGAVVGASLS